MIRLNGRKLSDWWNKVRGIPIERDLDPYRQILVAIDAYDLRSASDRDLMNVSARLRDRALQGIGLDDLLIEAFALVREAAWRTVGLRPFDVQLIAGIALHQGKLTEMSTGEGKTLVAVLPAFLNALTGKGVHVLTFNDYLARRDTAWMGPIFEFLGLRVGCIQEGMSSAARKKAYAADVTYATAKEAGFDFLRDHLVYEVDELVHRDFHFAIVDEADSILIDEARIPLVIAGRTETREEISSGSFAEIAKGLQEDVDFSIDAGRGNIHLTDAGVKRVENALGCDDLHAAENLDRLTRLHQAIHAEFLLRRDIDYIVRSGKIEIVDEFTGRVVEDRHWPDGLQAAVEAKERLDRGSGGSVLGTITLQHFLQLYPKVSGMTATATPAAGELEELYHLSVVVIPPHRPCIRKDQPDLVFTHKAAKKEALIEEIRSSHAARRPVLVGTASVQESEELACALEEMGVACRVLNAKNDEWEAEIVSQAGRPGAVTISTNMAGRGTDIKLGGDREQARDEVVALGGLYVIGTNRHESLRVDRQLRGRAGRQGDPGSTRFFISLEDDLIERYGVRRLLPKKYRRSRQSGPVEDPLVNREIARGQRIVEGRNLEIRKTLRRYSLLLEMQREHIQRRRQAVLHDGSTLGVLETRSPDRYAAATSLLGKDRVQETEKQITLYQFDRCWADHLAFVADVREGIHLASVGGRSPLDEFHRIVNEAFSRLESQIEDGIVRSFESLPVSKDAVDLSQAGIRGPSSTWTYLISDNSLDHWVGMLHGSNIGATATAAAVYAPLYLTLALVQRFWRKKED